MTGAKTLIQILQCSGIVAAFFITQIKNPASMEAGFFLNVFSKRCDQPRVRERIWKLSNVYSATCHHRYSSPR